MELEQSLLVIYPHPDDEAYTCAGLIALHTQANKPVTVVCGTQGQMGRNMGHPFFATRETLPLLRSEEMKNACIAMGVTDLRMMGLRDKTVEFEDKSALMQRIRGYIDEVKPSLVVTYYPGYAVHPDHNALGAAVVGAIEQMPAAERPKLYCVAFSDGCREVLGEPDVVLDVRSVWDKKRDALKAHTSQTAGMFHTMERQMEEDPSILEQYMNRFGTEAFWTYRFPDSAS